MVQHTPTGDNTLLEQGKVDAAITQFQRALDVDPDLANAAFLLGCASAKQGRLDDAITQYKRAIQIDPHLVKAYRGWAEVLDKQGKHGEAAAKRGAADKIWAESQIDTGRLRLRWRPKLGNSTF